MIDIDIQNEIIKLKDRVNKWETLLNTRFNIIEISNNELFKTLQKLWLNILFMVYAYFYI